ncbi:MAG: hypothetical protein VYE15_01610 [Myxococcota bacterium]|nr:hypothetical protein [Myxococcota bacterium]
MNNARTRLIILVLAATAVACSGDETPEESADLQGLASVKADCPDCDPAGPNAFVQAQIGEGFYEAGQSWQVAFRYSHSPQAEMRGDVFLERDTATSEVYLFGYRVLETDKMIADSVLRQTATIEVEQDTPEGPSADLFGQERLDGDEHRVRFSMNDLLEPIAETVYSRRYPNGKRVVLDAKSSLKAGASVFPRTIPRLLVEGAEDTAAPELPADLQDVADAMNPEWSTGLYRRYTFDNGDVVYWGRSRGQYWPFYTRNRQGEGVLVSWNGPGRADR